MKAFKAFIKRFEIPQRRIKIKISVNFVSSCGIGGGRVNYFIVSWKRHVPHGDIQFFMFSSVPSNLKIVTS